MLGFKQSFEVLFVELGNPIGGEGLLAEVDLLVGEDVAEVFKVWLALIFDEAELLCSVHVKIGGNLANSGFVDLALLSRLRQVRHERIYELIDGLAFHAILQLK